MEIISVSHSLSAHNLGILRNKATHPAKFRESLDSVSQLLFIESSRQLSTEVYKVHTALETTIAAHISRPIILIPILRAGLAMLQGPLKIMPDAIVQHLGIKRDEETFKPIPYYSSLDSQIKGSTVFILDPMLATGGTLAYAIREIAEFHPVSIEILTIISAPEGIENITQTADKIDITVRLWTISIDRELNKNGYILPGLGDAGDRAFGTM